MTTSVSHELTLPEELLLLALDDESGAGRADLAVAGGILAELVLQGVVVVESEGKKARVRATASAVSDGNELLSECLDDINARAADKPDKPWEASRWVTKFSSKKDLKARTAATLVASGVLDERKRKFLFIKLTQYPEANPVPEAEMTERLRSALEDDHVVPDERTVTLLAIANAASLLTKNLDKKMLRSRKDRLKELSEGDHVSEAVSASIAAVNAAVMVAVTAGAVASS